MYRRSGQGRDIVHRWEGNPLIRIEDLGFMCGDIHSTGVAFYHGEQVLLVTLEHLSGQQAIHLAHADKSGSFHVEEQPFLRPSRDGESLVHEVKGVMDARVTKIDGIYYIMYLAHGEHGYRIGLAKTEDFKSVERIGLVSEPDTKAGALFPKKIDGKFARLERPSDGGSIWISYSKDLIHWGGSELVLSPREGYWDTTRTGTGSPPYEVDEGWLFIYYGVKATSAGPLFRLGAALLDKKDPSKVVGRTNTPILAPREAYERIGDVPNLVYCAGADVCPDDGSVRVFYGAADSCICIGTTTVEEILESCRESSEEF